MSIISIYDEYTRIFFLRKIMKRTSVSYFNKFPKAEQRDCRGGKLSRQSLALFTLC